ncbi:MAG: tetratricopeptide repeat protein [Candidatus Marinimicrobia bacterium]|nr:tetratricopeptide repeat protein [Candidatus Neomarinimicrobiota bacterium]
MVAINLSAMVTHNYIGLASLYETNGELFDSSSQKIALLYDEARVLSPSNLIYRYNFAEILLKAGIYDRAIESLEGTIGSGPQLKNSLTLLAEAYRLSGDTEKAGVTIDKKLIEDPIDGFANFVKGNVLIDLEKSDEAIIYYLKALEKSRGDNRIDVLKRLALTYWDNGDAERATEYLNKILNERPYDKFSLGAVEKD